MAESEAAYLRSANNGLLRDKVRKVRSMLSRCALCPRQCGIDRLSGQTGVCKTGEKAWVSSCNPHFGEEAPLVGQYGSGTIFMTHCNLMCNFCQNYDISHGEQGIEVSDGQLAEMMLSLQQKGCHNINFVTPSHVVPQILSAVEIAAGKGLTVPLVYNTSGYDTVETLKLLDGVFDIYMPDFKFWDPEVARQTCDAGDYPEMARRAVKEMHRQVGDLNLNESGIATRGLLIRHLVMPGGLAGTQEIMTFIADNLSVDSYVNIMPQYRPEGDAVHIPGLSRHISQKEFASALQLAAKSGIKRFDEGKRI